MLGRKVIHVRCINCSYNNIAKGIKHLHASHFSDFSRKGYKYLYRYMISGRFQIWHAIFKKNAPDVNHSTIASDPVNWETGPSNRYTIGIAGYWGTSTLNAPIATKVVCFSRLLKSMANSVDPDQTAPIGAVCSGSMLFASILISSVMLGNYLQQTTSADDIFRCIFFLAL